MNGNDLGTAIVNAIKTVDGSMTVPQIAQLTTAWQAIGTAIVSYVTANAVVSTNDTGTATVTTAPGTAPVTATGTGTVA